MMGRAGGLLHSWLVLCTLRQAGLLWSETAWHALLTSSGQHC